MEQTLSQLLLLLGVTVAVAMLFQHLRLPASLAYLLVGVLLGSHTAGPAIDDHYVRLLAEFGIVFLLFTIGLSFPFAHIYALRHLILGTGTAQVVLTTLLVMGIYRVAGIPAGGAFVLGAIFAQSSTTIISRQLLELGEDQARHGRLATAMSVFQDVTAVPFVVLIPVLGGLATTSPVWSLTAVGFRAVLAFGMLFLIGRFLLQPLFRLITVRHSSELFTVTVLFVSLLASWITIHLGLSMAFGAFLAGTMLGETEFRHQIESTIRPFRDILLGLFFVSIGMLVQPSLLPDIWLETVCGTLILVSSKVILVTGIVRAAGIEKQTAFRTGMLLGVGGEFGFALLAIGVDSGLLSDLSAQVALMSVLSSMIVGPFLIRYNQALAALCFPVVPDSSTDHMGDQQLPVMRQHVVICGFGRIGQIVSRFLEQQKIAFVATDLDAARVREAYLAGFPVYYGDSADAAVLETLGVSDARLLIISHDDLTAAIKTLQHARKLNPGLTIIVRSRDERHLNDLREAGASEVISETLEAGMMVVSHSLLALDVPLEDVTRCIDEQRRSRYQMIRELFVSPMENVRAAGGTIRDQLHAIVLTADSPAVGVAINSPELSNGGVELTALVRAGRRILSPPVDTRLEVGDVLVLFGPPDEIRSAELRLTGGSPPNTD